VASAPLFERNGELLGHSPIHHLSFSLNIAWNLHCPSFNLRLLITLCGILILLIINLVTKNFK
jgi:hypothetical protein